MKIPVIYHTLKPLVDIGIDKFNTTDGKEMDHETTTIFFLSLSLFFFLPSRVYSFLGWWRIGAETRRIVYGSGIHVIAFLAKCCYIFRMLALWVLIKNLESGWARARH